MGKLQGRNDLDALNSRQVQVQVHPSSTRSAGKCSEFCTVQLCYGSLVFAMTCAGLTGLLCLSDQAYGKG